MSYYEKLNIGSYMGHEVVVKLKDGTYRVGLLDIDIANEDWKEDGEREAFALEIDGLLIEIYMDNVLSIGKISEVRYAEAV